MKHLLLALVALSSVSASARQIAALGACGDSLSDEYIEESYGSYARNWTMMFRNLRQVNLGPTAAEASQPGNSWGEPRRTGYAFDWARYGATTANLLSQGQHTGLAAQAAPSQGGVSHAVLFIGANNFAPTNSAYFSIYLNLWSAATISAYVNQTVTEITTAATALKSAGMQVVMVNLVDFGATPVVRSLYGNAANRERVTNVIATINARLRDAARQQQATYVDFFAMGRAVFGTNAAPFQTLLVGNTPINLLQQDTAAHANPFAGFVDDGAHPHTAIQGVVANTILTALRLDPRVTIPLLSEQEIMAYAGLPYGGSETVVGQIGPYGQWVTEYRCTGDTNRDNTVNFADLNAVLGDFGQTGPNLPTDLDRDGRVNFADLNIVLGAFGTGC